MTAGLEHVRGRLLVMAHGVPQREGTLHGVCDDDPNWCWVVWYDVPRRCQRLQRAKTTDVAQWLVETR